MPINIEAGIIDFDDPLEDLPAHVKTDLKRIALIAFACILAIEFLVVFILMFAFPAPRPKRKDGETVKTLVVLGSGGHTAEMLKLVNSLDKKVYSPRVYVSAETDKLSGKKAFEAEKGYQTDGKAKDCDFYVVPRSREVGQSYFTSIFTTLYSIMISAVLVWQVKPDVVLVNGPGTCIPLCVAAFLYRRLHIKYCDVVYVESIARVKSLSLSGKILYNLRLTDVFMVQWKELQDKYPRSKFADRLF